MKKDPELFASTSSQMPIFALILDSINLASILQFSDLAPTRHRSQSFDNCLDDEPRVGNPLRQYLVTTPYLNVYVSTTFRKIV